MIQLAAMENVRYASSAAEKSAAFTKWTWRMRPRTTSPFRMPKMLSLTSVPSERSSRSFRVFTKAGWGFVQ